MRRILILLCLLWSADAAFASRIDTVFVTSDSVSLALSYYVPASAMPASGYPAILCVHGFGGSKADYDAVATVYANAGYFVVAYTVRGEGIGAPAGNQSGGQFNWFTGDRELQDVAEIIDWMRRLPDVDSTRVGMEGASQGGLTTWGAIAKHVPVKCAVPIIAVPNYAETFTFNGCMNYAFVAAVNGAQQLGRVNLGKYITDTIIPTISADNYSSLTQLLGKRDLGAKIRSVNIPIFLQCSWYDQLFGTGAVLHAYDSIRTPKKLLIWAGDHSVPGGAIGDERLALTLRFYNRWLRGDTTENIMNPDSAVTFYETDNSSSFATSNAQLHANLEPQTFTKRYFFGPGGSLMEQPQSQPLVASSAYIQNLTNDLTYYFTTPPLDSDRTFMNAGAYLQLGSSGLRYQANILLWDVDDTGHTVMFTRGASEVRTDKAGRATIAYRLNPVVHTIRKGHRLRASLKFGMPLLVSSDEFGQSAFAPQESAFDTLFSQSQQYSYLVFSAFQLPDPAAVRPETVGVTQPTSSIVVLLGEPILAASSETVLYDLRGVCVSHADVNLLIPTEHLTPGLYFLRDRRSSGVVMRKVLILRDH
ncbi:MAG: prolyl oligopeptidase family serine peptidase [Bacteroidetes bacterium]|nr:prolyl oligopeptidase family serine peptidase [Bacteroidota bacterium]